MFMNEYEIDEARHRYRGHPVLGPATATLAALRDAANENSDGWCYWPKPSRAAQQLQELITVCDRFDDERADATPERLRKVYAPLRAFRTRTGIQFKITEVSDRVKP